MGGSEADWLSTSADSLSLVSFGLAVYTALTVSRIRRRIVGRARLPGLIEEVVSAKDELLLALKETGPDDRDLKLVLVRTEAHLNALEGIAGPVKGRIKSMKASIRRFADQSEASTAEARSRLAWSIYIEFNGLLVELNSLEKEQRIS